ncbi:UPF0644 protein [Smittium culicis]|uniref:UPF0644 protein n=1 Tax=Smittium culicis TaxID=133412 RepID=A0A1R1XY45_9FUNG|nr:UPF0644 protein [Smittium culicis]
MSFFSLKSTIAKFVYTNCAALAGAGLALYAVDKGYLRTSSLFGKKPSSTISADSVDERAVPNSKIESEIASLKLVKDLRADTSNWRELPITFGIDESSTQQSFMHTTFNQPDHLLAVPKMFVNSDKKQVVFVFYIGKKLCGHPGIMHGGVQAMLYDEAMARPALLNLPRNTGFTAYLNIQYKKPAVVDQLLIMRTDLADLSGRKALVKASIENVDGVVLSTAESLFVSPSNPSILKDNSDTLGTL